MNDTKNFRKVKFFDLEPKKKYIITEMHNSVHYIGIFYDYERTGFSSLDKAVFKEVTEINPLERDDNYNMYYILGHSIKDELFWKLIFPEKLKYEQIFSQYYTFYDLEEIRENGEKARQRMEQRSLDIILKRLVNENFQW